MATREQVNTETVQGMAGKTLSAGLAAADPTVPLGLATKNYVDVAVAAVVQIGTPLVLDPYTVSVAPSQAHGLGAEPDYLKVVLECKIAELGYSVGDRLLVGLLPIHNLSVGNTAWGFEISATLVTLFTGSSVPWIVNKGTPGGITNFTAANWKLTATPYKFA
jgi:hypothetical protein